MDMRLLQGPKRGFIVIDYILLILSMFATILVLQSISRLRFGLFGYRQFLLSLLASGLFICGVNLISFIYQALSLYEAGIEMTKTGADVIRCLQLMGFIAHLFNLSGMSLDHYIGILYPLRYNQLLSKRYVRIAVALIWVLAFLFGFVEFFANLASELLGPDNRLQTNKSSDALQFSSYNSNTTTPSSNQTLEQIWAILNIFQPKSPMNFSEEKTARDSKEKLGDSSSTDHVSKLLETILFSILNSTNQSSSSADEPVDYGDGSSEQATVLDQIIDIKRRKKAMNYPKNTNKAWLEISVMLLTVICFVFLTFCYGKIFREVSTKVNRSERNTRKIVITTFLLLGSFTICWLPFMVFEMVMIYEIKTATSYLFQRSSSFFAIHNAFNTLLMCSPLLDPIIYAWRMRVIRRYIFFRYFKCFPCVHKYALQMKSRDSILTMTTCSNRASESRNGGFYFNHTKNLMSPNHQEDHNRHQLLVERNINHNFLTVPHSPLKRRHSDHALPPKSSLLKPPGDLSMTGGNNPLSVNGGERLCHSFDLSEVWKYIDDDEDNGDDGNDNISRIIASQQQQRLPVSEISDNENLMQVFSLHRVASSPGCPVLNSMSLNGDATPVKQNLPTPVTNQNSLRSNKSCSTLQFADSDAVLAHFRVNSFRLLGAGAYCRNSVTLNCPTINY